MNKFLVICGPTATGKTSLALTIANKFNGEVISADSRQVYKGLDISTGKDIPRNSKLGNSYHVDGIPIWGYDLVGPKDDFSVASYVSFASKKIKDIMKRNKLPILIGGNGLYIKAVVDGIETVNIKKNSKLRKILKEKSVSDLFEMLAQIDSFKAASMNISDKNNPRRLVRAIEIASQIQIPRPVKVKGNQKGNLLFIGLNTAREVLNSRISERVHKRIDQGIEHEIRDLLIKGVNWKNQSMYSLGVRQFKEYFEGDKSILEVIVKWTKEEQKYAKRQMTWFKRDKRINWFDISDIGFEKKVLQLVQNWYAEKN